MELVSAEQQQAVVCHGHEAYLGPLGPVDAFLKDEVLVAILDALPGQRARLGLGGPKPETRLLVHPEAGPSLALAGRVQEEDPAPVRVQVDVDVELVRV